MPADGAEALHHVTIGAAGRHLAGRALVDRFPAKTRTTAPAALASQIGHELVAQHAPRYAYFRLLDIASVGGAQSGHRAQALVAVKAPHRPAAAVVIEAGAHIALTGARIDGEDVVAAMLGPGGDGAMRHRLRQRLEHRLHHLRADIDWRGADRRGVLAIHH